MKKKIISGILAVSLSFSLLPAYADLILKSDLVQYDFFDFDEASSAAAGYKVAKGFENTLELSHMTEGDVDFLRMKNKASSNANVNNTVPYLYLPINNGTGITYQSGKKIGIEMKFRTNATAYSGKSNDEYDQRFQLKYNIPYDVSTLSSIRNPEDTRGYNVGYNDCNLWGAECNVFRVPNGSTTSSLQTNMSGTKIPYSANNWYVVKAYIDHESATTAYEIENCTTGETYTATGVPYFSLGTSLTSLAIANMFAPLTQMDIDYLKVYDYAESEVSDFSWSEDFEYSVAKDFTVTNADAFKFTNETSKSGKFSVLTQNDVYTFPMEFQANSRYAVTVSWKEKTPSAGTTLSITANTASLDSETVKDGEWNTTTAVYQTTSAGEISFSTKLSNSSQYYIDDFYIEKIVPKKLAIKGPDQVLKGEDTIFTPVIITDRGKEVPLSGYAYTFKATGSNVTTMSGNTLTVPENEKFRTITIELESVALDKKVEKQVEVIDEIESTVTYEDSDGTPLYSGVSDNGVKSNVTVTNRAGELKKMTLAAAVYEGNVLKSVLGVENFDLAAGATVTKNFGPYQGLLDTEQLKVFVWKEMKPTSMPYINKTTDILQEIYVATDGSDSNPGTIDLPLATLEGARDYIRAHGVPEGGMTVYIRGGTYYRDTVFTLSANDSGTKDRPVTYKAYKNEKPVFTQGVDIPLSNATKVTDTALLSKLPDQNAKNHLYSINLRNFGITELAPATYPGAYTTYVNDWIDKQASDSKYPSTISKVPTGTTNEVFFDGKPMTIARYPNGDSWIYMNQGELVNCGAIPRFWEDNMVGFADYVEPQNRNINDCFTIKYTDRVDRWTNAKDALMFGFWYHNWATQTVGIGSINTTNNTITSDIPSYFGVRDDVPGNQFAKYYVYNLIEELDTDGEYYFDRDNLILYFYRSDDMTDSDKITVGKGASSFINVSNASYINIEGIEFTAGRALGIDVVGNNITVKDCTIHNLSSSPIRMNGENNVVDGCNISDVNGSVIITSDGSYKNDFKRGNSVVKNSTITNFSRISHVYTSAVSLSGVGNAAINNKISESYHMAVSLGGYDCLLQGNEIFNVCKYANDAAAVYNGRNWLTRGNSIIGNYFHDINPDPVWAKAHGVNAIFADDIQANVIIKGNIFENIDGYAVKFNGGADHIVENNTFINCGRRGMLPGGTVDIGRVGGVNTDDYNIAMSCVNHLEGLVSNKYFNDAWETDSHSVAEIKTVGGVADVDVSPIENFVLFLKSAEWGENEAENITKYINQAWHTKYPEIYEYLRYHGGDTYNNKFTNNVLIDTDPSRQSNMTTARYSETGTIEGTRAELLALGDWRALNYESMDAIYNRVKVSSENMGISGVIASANSQGLVINDQCTTADNFGNFDKDYGTITTGEDSGVSYVRLTNSQAASGNRQAAMFYDMGAENIHFAEDETVTIDTRVRYKVTDTASSGTGPYMAIKLNAPEDIARISDYKMVGMNNSGEIEEKTNILGGYYNAMVAFLNQQYSYALGFVPIGETGQTQTKMIWSANSAEFTSLGQLTPWIRVVITLDKTEGKISYQFYNENDTLLLEKTGCDLANYVINNYLDNITFGQVNPARGDITIDVDYVKVNVNKK